MKTKLVIFHSSYKENEADIANITSGGHHHRIRIIRLEKTFKIIIKSKLNPGLSSPLLNHVSKCHIYISFKDLQDGDSTTSPCSLFQCFAEEISPVLSFLVPVM